MRVVRACTTWSVLALSDMYLESDCALLHSLRSCDVWCPWGLCASGHAGGYLRVGIGWTAGCLGNQPSNGPHVAEIGLGSDGYIDVKTEGNPVLRMIHVKIHWMYNTNNGLGDTWARRRRGWWVHCTMTQMRVLLRDTDA